MIGYKVFDEGFMCTHGNSENITMEIGKTYTLDGKPKIASNGYHFCLNLLDCFNYYPIDMRTRIAKIDAIGDIDVDGNKCCTNKIKLLKEISWEEIEQEILNENMIERV